MSWSQSLAALTLSAFLVTLFPQVQSSIPDNLVTCDFGTKCAFRRHVVLNNILSREDAMEQCCEGLQGAFFFHSGTCNPCPIKFQTESSKILDPPASLGSASDLIVSLRCTAGGQNVSFDSGVGPFWRSPNVSFATVDKEDKSLVRIEAARVTEELRLECNFSTNSVENRQEFRINPEDSLFGAEGEDKELPDMGGVTLRCPTPELPDRNVTWFQAPDVKLSTGRELSVTDTGLYFCVGTDERGTFVSNYISVYNQGAPSNDLSFSASLPNEVLRTPGSDVPLTCSSDGSSDVEWLYNGMVISGATDSTYTIPSLTESTSGYYQCRIGGQNPESIVSSSYVHTASAVVSGENCALLGVSQELECTFDYPTMERELKWRWNGQLVNEDGRRTVTTTRNGSVSVSRLVIDQVEDADNGTYACEVRVVGTDDVITGTFQLITVATPDEPQNLGFSMITQTEARVMWDASESEGNLPIVNYYIQWMNKTEDTWREATVEASGELAYTITGLKTFTEYSVRVFASNGKYNGTAAEMDLTSGEDTPANPPRNLSARPIHANEMELRWEEPAEPLRGKIVEYIVTYRLKGSSSNVRVRGVVRTVTVVMGLEPESEYEFFVEAATSAGSGPPTGPVTHTTLSIALRQGPSTPSVNKILSTTVQVELPLLQSDTGVISHYQLVVVKLACPTSNIDSNPDEMFPNPEDLPLYDDHQVGQAYIAAEIDAGKLTHLLATTFVIGDENHNVAQMNDVAEYRNGPLEPEACYSFFMRGFLSVPQAIQAKRRRDVLGERRYRTFVSSDFMAPIQTLPEEKLLQIRFFSVDSCTTWTNTNTVAKISALKEEVAQVVDAVCSCNFNASDIVSASFSCKNPGADSGEAVVLRMTVREKNGFGAPSAVMAVSEWASDAPSITINLVQYTVSSSCPTELSSETDPDCGPSPVEGSNSMSIIIGSSVAAGVVTLILVVAIVVMVIWMCRRSSKAKYETDERGKSEGTEHQSPNGVVIPNSPSQVDAPTGDPRPKVIGRSTQELLNEGANYYAPYPPPHPLSTSMASLNSAGGASPHPHPMQLPPGVRPQVMGMHVWAPHLHSHHRTASGASIGVESFVNPSPAHSRQPSDVITDVRRHPADYSYFYSYQYPYMPQPMYMYGSPVGHRRVATLDAELEAFHHDRQDSGNSMQGPRRPNTADLLEREIPRGMSPYSAYYYHHYPQESDVSHITSASEQPFIHPFPRREPLRVMRGYNSAGKIPNGAVGEPSEGKVSMERFLDTQLEQHRKNTQQDVVRPGSNDVRSDASEVSSTLEKPDSSVELDKSVNSIESEVL